MLISPLQNQKDSDFIIPIQTGQSGVCLVLLDIETQQLDPGSRMLLHDLFQSSPSSPTPPPFYFITVDLWIHS